MKEIDRLNKTVDEFAEEMKARLRQKHKEGFRGWGDSYMALNLDKRLIQKATKLVREKKDIIDIANLAMMLWNLARKDKL